jgi:hypothetical protein
MFKTLIKQQNLSDRHWRYQQQYQRTFRRSCGGQEARPPTTSPTYVNYRLRQAGVDLIDRQKKRPIKKGLMRPKVQNIGDLSAQAIGPEPTTGSDRDGNAWATVRGHRDRDNPSPIRRARVASGCAKEFLFPQKGTAVAASP